MAIDNIKVFSKEPATYGDMNTYVSRILRQLIGRAGTAGGDGTLGPGTRGDPIEFESALVLDSYTTAQRTAITSPINGTMMYDSTTNKMNVRENGAWTTFEPSHTHPYSLATHLHDQRYGAQSDVAVVTGTFRTTGADTYETVASVWLQRRSADGRVRIRFKGNITVSGSGTKEIVFFRDTSIIKRVTITRTESVDFMFEDPGYRPNVPYAARILVTGGSGSMTASGTVTNDIRLEVQEVITP